MKCCPKNKAQELKGFNGSCKSVGGLNRRAFVSQRPTNGLQNIVYNQDNSVQSFVLGGCNIMVECIGRKNSNNAEAAFTENGSFTSRDQTVTLVFTHNGEQAKKDAIDALIDSEDLLVVLESNGGYFEAWGWDVGLKANGGTDTRGASPADPNQTTVTLFAQEKALPKTIDRGSLEETAEWLKSLTKEKFVPNLFYAIGNTGAQEAGVQRIEPFSNGQAVVINDGNSAPAGTGQRQWLVTDTNGQTYEVNALGGSEVISFADFLDSQTGVLYDSNAQAAIPIAGGTPGTPIPALALSGIGFKVVGYVPGPETYTLISVFENGGNLEVRNSIDYFANTSVLHTIDVGGVVADVLDVVIETDGSNSVFKLLLELAGSGDVYPYVFSVPNSQILTPSAYPQSHDPLTYPFNSAGVMLDATVLSQKEAYLTKVVEATPTSETVEVWKTEDNFQTFVQVATLTESAQNTKNSVASIVAFDSCKQAIFSQQNMFLTLDGWKTTERYEYPNGFINPAPIAYPGQLKQGKKYVLLENSKVIGLTKTPAKSEPVEYGVWYFGCISNEKTCC